MKDIQLFIMYTVLYNAHKINEKKGKKNKYFYKLKIQCVRCSKFCTRNVVNYI